MLPSGRQAIAAERIRLANARKLVLWRVTRYLLRLSIESEPSRQLTYTLQQSLLSWDLLKFSLIFELACGHVAVEWFQPLERGSRPIILLHLVAKAFVEFLNALGEQTTCSHW